MLKSRMLLTACWMLLAVDVILAQARPAADPISGTWSGHIEMGETNRATVNIDLRLDGRAVSGKATGPQLRPGEIRSGSFDPRTGALSFEVVVQGDGTIVLFDGTVARDTASGKLRMNDQTGAFTIAKQAGARPTTVQRPVAPEDPSAAAIRRSFTEVSGWVTRAADLVPADRYTYRPAPAVRTFGQLIGHIADSYNYYCGRAAGRNVQWSGAIEQGSTDKATLVAKLKQTLDACHASYTPAPAADGQPRETPQVGPLVDNIGHTNLHYGNIITYMRMLGLVPPST